MIDQLREARYGVEALFALGFAPLLFARGFVKLNRYRRIQNTPTCKIRSLPMGSVEVIGVARSEEAVAAPFSGKAAVWYEVEIQELRRSGRRSRWVTRHKASSGLPFHLDDGTGTVLVLPDGVEAHTPLDYDHRSVHTNSHTTKYEADGSFRLVVAHEDPGVPNWMDTAGHDHGIMGVRWVRADSLPEPRCRLVKLADVRGARGAAS